MRRRGRYSGKGESVPGLVLLVVLVCTCGSTAKGADPNQPSAIDSVLVAVGNCMTRSPAPWPEPWTQEYLDTIRQAVAAKPDASEYARRLQIVQEGFALYWSQLKNTPERSFFEVRRAQIHWYVENLMASALPSPDEVRMLRRQYEDLANHAAQGLVAQFSFLDPNRVQEARADYLADCYRKIDAPLLPIFLTSLSPSQIEKVKERWHDLRYARVDLWRQLGGHVTSPGDPTASSGREHPDYRLMRGSLDQWEGQIWALVTRTPEYYQTAILNDLKAQKERYEAMSRARERESDLSNATMQTEYLTFLLGTLLETAREEFSGSTDVRDTAMEGR
jgi:hypothetical protein